jgi:hypothetical protein
VDPDEFRALRGLPGKKIEVDIEFVNIRKLAEHVLVFDDAPVVNSMNLPVVVGGQYNRKTGRLTFHFTLEGCGLICRLCVNGADHKEDGRTHKHELEAAGDVRKHLPSAKRREDLLGKRPREVWEILCRNAHIEHNGRFVDPPE